VNAGRKATRGRREVARWCPRSKNDARRATRGHLAAVPPRDTLRVIDAAEEFVVQVNRSRPGRNWVYSGQLRKSVGSVYANLVDGYGRGPGADRNRLYVVARAECEETLGWIRQARNANKVAGQEFFKLLNRGVVIVRMINNLIL